VELGEDQTVVKSLVIDSERRPVIELIFRLALRGRKCTQIARSLNDAGWLTKPNKRGRAPRTWTAQNIHKILRNPRYAGLASLKGEIFGQASWPAYISKRQYFLITKRLAERRLTRPYRSRQSYLLGCGLARCGYCGARMGVHAGKERKDGSFARRYVCAS